MKKPMPGSMTVVLAGAVLLCATASGATDVSGKWLGSVSGSPIYLILKQEGRKLSGSGGPDEQRQVMKFDNGSVEDDRLLFQAGSIQCDLRVSGDVLKGEMKNGDDTATILLTRVEALQKQSQAPAAETAALRFEVASVKTNKSSVDGGISGRGGSIRPTPGQILMENVTLWKCLGFAYGIGEDKDYAIAGPEWLKSERYDIVAKFPASTSWDQARIMLRNLLIDRFKMSLHRETKEMPIYALVVAKSGSKLHQAEFGRGSFNMSRGQIKAQKAAIPAFAERLSQFVDHPVFDMTGLTGVFDISLEWTPDDAPSAPAPDGGRGSTPGPSVFTAIQQQLGLRLEARKGPVEILIVDRAEKVPVEN